MWQMIWQTLAQVQIDPPPFQVRSDDLITGLNRVFFWAGVVAVVMIVFAGIQYITSTGDTNKAVTAKHAIYYSALGLILILLAFAIVNIVLRMF